MITAAMSLLPDGISHVWQFVVLGSISAVLFSMAKTGFGGSVGLLATTVMVYATGDAPLALGIMLPMLIVADYAAVASWWRRWELRQVLGLMPGTAVGIAIAWLMMEALMQAGGARKDLTRYGLQLAVGMVALGFVALQVLRALTRRKLAFRPVAWQAAAAGATAGVTSTLAHAAGPVVAMYLLPQQMPKDRYVATTALFFWVANQLKLPAYSSLGLINMRTLGVTVVLLPAIAAGAVLGVALHKRLGQGAFMAVVHTLLAATGLQFTIDAVIKLR